MNPKEWTDECLRFDEEMRKLEDRKDLTDEEKTDIGQNRLATFNKKMDEIRAACRPVCLSLNGFWHDPDRA